MNTQMISSTCIALVGVLLVILSILFFLKEKRLKKNCISMAKGNVIKYKYLGSNNARSISPVVEYTVDGKKYNAYRHYKKIISKNKYVLNNDESDNFYILDDTFYINTIGVYHNYRLLAEEKWPLGTELPVFYNEDFMKMKQNDGYNPKNPKQGFVEKVVTINKTVGIVLLCAGVGLIILSFISYILLSL